MTRLLELLKTMLGATEATNQRRSILF
uniref:Uncharacterized protein n=1 Tax=Anguilla anguilla TaxID=7936 RepID=A0A0E9R2T9_ANGAN